MRVPDSDRGLVHRALSVSWSRILPARGRLLLCLLLFALPTRLHAQAYDVEVKLELPPAAKFTNDLAVGGVNCDRPVRLECEGPDVTCNNQALNLAGYGIEKANMANAAWEAVKGTFKVSKDLLKAMFPGIGKASDVADALLRTMSSESFGDFVKNMAGFGVEKMAGKAGEQFGDQLEGMLAKEISKFMWNGLFPKDVKREEFQTVSHAGCGDITVLKKIEPLGENAILFTVTVAGNCQCKWPGPHPMKGWFVSGQIVLSPQVTVTSPLFGAEKITITYKAGDNVKPTYKVTADCDCELPGYGLFIPRTGGTTVGYAGSIPSYVLSYDNSKWCTYLPAPSDDPRDVPVEEPPDEPRDVPVPPPTDEPRDVPIPTPTPTQPRDKPTPDEPRDVPTPDEPRDVPVPALTVKAKTSVIEGGQTQVRSLQGALVKFSAPPPSLPIAGNEKDEIAEHDADPIQGVTGADGTVTLTSSGPQQPGSTPGAAAGPQKEVDLTPQESKNVGITPDPELEDYLDGKTYVPSSLKKHLTQSFALGETALILSLTYPKTVAGQVDNWIQTSNHVLYSEVNYCRDKQVDDPYFSSKGSWNQKYDDQWAIKRVGFKSTADSPWSQIKKPRPVIVAVIDTGLDWNHQDISWDQIWQNKKEIPNNGIDDDGNGYVDDVIGWNFISKNNLPWDDDGHGTFVTGVIAATRGNGLGISGINPYAQIMVLKALNAFGHTRVSFIAQAITYAADNGARVINISVGGKKLTRTEQIAIDYAYARGAVVVVAAGNEATDIADFGPAGNDHVIAVAASDFADKPAGYSNWGAGIDITAPGNDVLSLRARATDLMRDIPEVKYRPGDAYVGADKRYYRASGTSFAAPIVAGVASLLLSANPDLTNEQVERILLQSARDLDVPGVDQLTGYGLLNAGSALQADPKFYITAEITGVNVLAEGGAQSLQVLGTANANQLKRYWVEVGSGKNPARWKRVSTDSTRAVKGAVLTIIPATEFQTSPTWIIRVIVEHQGGKSREARFDLQLE